MKKKSPGGSGSAAHKGQAGQPHPKDKGRRGTHRKRAQTPPYQRKELADGAPASVGDVSRVRPQAIVITIGEGHPRCEEGTFDAAALLASVLAGVEPKMAEGLRALEEMLDSGEDGSEELAQTIRAVGRQMAESVRAGVVEGMRSRDRHLAQLAVIDRAAAQASALTQLQERIDKELALAGLRRISDLSDLSTFDLADGTGTLACIPSDGDAFELVSPAYVDAETGRTIERGWIRSLQAAGEAAAPAGKRHGSASRKHKERRQDETTARDDATSSAERLDEAAHQEAPTTSRNAPSPSSGSVIDETPVAAVGEQERRRSEDDATTTRPPRDAHGPKDQGNPGAECSGASSANSESLSSPRPMDEAADVQGTDVRADSASRTAAPEPAAHYHAPGAAEEAEQHSVVEPASTSDRKMPGRKAARTPGTVGSVSMPRRVRARQTVDEASDNDNQVPRRTS